MSIHIPLITRVQNDGTNSHHGYRYASLASIVSRVAAAFARSNRLHRAQNRFRWELNRDEEWGWHVNYVIYDAESGESIVADRCPLLVPPDLRDHKLFRAQLTSAKKVTMLNAHGIGGSADDIDEIDAKPNAASTFEVTDEL
jgi:hypothetical protein